MSVVVLLCILNVYGYNKDSKGKGYIPEIPDDLFLNDVHKGPIPDKIFPDKGNILTGEELLQRHQDRLRDIIGINILPPNDKGYNGGNHYYKGDEDKSILNKYKRWYRPPRFPFTNKGITKGNKGGTLPTKGPPAPYTKRPTRQPTPKPIDTTSSPTLIATDEPTVAPSMNPSLTPSIGQTIEPSLTPSQTPSISPTQSCNFTGQFTFDDPTDPRENIFVCESNGTYFVGIDNGNNFTVNIARGTQLTNIADGQAITLSQLELTFDDLPCFFFSPQVLTCRFGDPDVFQYGTAMLTKVSDIPDPLQCFQSATDFNSFNDPLLFTGTQSQAQHLTNSPTGDCLSNTLGICEYEFVNGTFDNTVRVACCGDSNPQQASFFTPNTQNTIQGVTLSNLQSGITGENDIYNITEMSGITCPI